MRVKAGLDAGESELSCALWRFVYYIMDTSLCLLKLLIYTEIMSRYGRNRVLGG